MTDQKLMNYFNFDEFDLTANSEGRITERQKDLLIKEDKANRRKERQMGLRLLIFALLFSVGSAGLSYYFTGEYRQFQTMLIFLDVVLICLAPLFVAFLGFYIIKTSFTRKSDFVTVYSTQGPVKHIRREIGSGRGGPNNGYYIINELHIEDVIFRVDERFNKVMKDGDSYKVYYANIAASDDDENINKIISAELISRT